MLNFFLNCLFIAVHLGILYLIYLGVEPVNKHDDDDDDDYDTYSKFG